MTCAITSPGSASTGPAAALEVLQRARRHGAQLSAVFVCPIQPGEKSTSPTLTRNPRPRGRMRDRQGFALRVVGDRVLCDQARKLDTDTQWFIESREPDLLAILQAEPTGAVH